MRTDQETRKNNRKRKLGIIKTVMYGRFIFIMLAFLAQLALMIIGYYRLRSYSFLFYLLFLFISAAGVLHIFNTSGNPDLKLSWMFPIAIFPVFGAIFYVFIVLQPHGRVFYRRLRPLFDRTGQSIHPSKEVWERLREENPHIGQLAYYLYQYDNSPAYERTQATYFSVGDEVLPAMCEELNKATSFIFLEYFIIAEGEFWNKIHDILRQKAAEGVEVRVMYDGTDVLFNLPNYYPMILESEGIQSRLFSPINPIFSPHYNNRDHRKIMVIDGRVAFTGGFNLADEYINKKERLGHWKDAGLMLQGDAVERLTCMFLEMWNSSDKQPEDFRKYLIDDVCSVPSDGYVIPYSVCPLGEERTGERVYLDIVNAAHKYVHFMTPYLILDHEMIMALSYAAKRGVEISIIMPHIPDKKTVFWLAKTYYKQLIPAGVQIAEYLPGFVHSKVCIADGYKAVVGTVNMDYRSFCHHFECGVILCRNSQIAKIEEDFEQTWEKCEIQTMEMIANRGIRERFTAWIMRIIAPLM